VAASRRNDRDRVLQGTVDAVTDAGVKVGSAELVVQNVTP